MRAGAEEAAAREAAAAEEEAAAAAEAVAFRAKRAARRRAELVAEGEAIGEGGKASGLVTAWSEARPGEPGYADENGVLVYREPGPQRHTYVVLELRPQPLKGRRARRNAQAESALPLLSDASLQLAGRVAVWREQVVRVMEADAQEAKAEANARQKERVALGALGVQSVTSHPGPGS